MALSVSIAVTNQSTVLSDTVVQEALPALQHQANYHFAPFWHVGARLYFAQAGVPLPKGMAHIAIVDDSDQAGALGYHDIDSTFTPDAFIFARTDQQYGLSWSVTFSHELLEMLADLWVSSAWQTSNTEFYAQEVCDPVEDDSLGYNITYGSNPSILVSDFILPRWFLPGSPPKYDYRGYCTAPLQILKGGYMSIFVSGKGWTQKQNFSGELEEVPLEVDERGFRTRPSAAVRYAYAEYKRSL